MFHLTWWRLVTYHESSWQDKTLSERWSLGNACNQTKTNYKLPKCFNISYVSFQTFCDIKDLSYGKENVPISCVNGIDRNYPDYVDYSTVRTPATGVPLKRATEEEFLCGCDCNDGCRVCLYEWKLDFIPFNFFIVPALSYFHQISYELNNIIRMFW